MKLYDKTVLRYANILCSVAHRARIESDSKKLLDLLDSDPMAFSILRSEYFPKSAKHEFMHDFCKKHKCSDDSLRFFCTIVDYNRIGNLRDIIELHAELCASHKGHQVVYAKTSGHIEKSIKKSIEIALSKKIGKEVSVLFEEDDSLIFGMTFTWQDKMIDLSVRSMMRSL